mmetsp:Transcript_11702/g.11754  ORF Transcript_11702/g.11754 Transcript_11702/m.11754 type:complete len:199 (-) Transcript_11702:98-694(-)
MTETEQYYPIASALVNALGSLKRLADRYLWSCNLALYNLASFIFRSQHAIHHSVDKIDSSKSASNNRFNHKSTGEKLFKEILQHRRIGNSFDTPDWLVIELFLFASVLDEIGVVISDMLASLSSDNDSHDVNVQISIIETQTRKITAIWEKIRQETKCEDLSFLDISTVYKAVQYREESFRHVKCLILEYRPHILRSL